MAGLTDVSRMIAGDAGEAPPQQAPAESPVLKVLQESQARSQEAMRALDARRNKLVELSMSRKNQMFNPQLLALASGMLAPTKTGSFGESLGYAARGMAEEQAKQQALDIQEAKMQYELEAEAMKQREALAAQGLLPAILGGKLGTPQAAAPNRAAPSGAAPAAQPAAPTQNMLDQLSDEELLALSSYPATKNVAETVLKLREASRKDKLKVKFGDQEREVPTSEYRALETALENNDWKAAKKWYEKHGLPWNYIEQKQPDGNTTVRPMTTAELEAEKSKAVEAEKAKYGKQEPVWVYSLGRYIPMNPKKAAEYDEAVSSGKEDSWIKANIPGMTPAKPAAGDASRPSSALPPKPEEQAGATTTSQEKAKSAVESRTTFVNRGMNADSIVQPAKEIFSLASDPTYSIAMGVIDAPGLGNVIAKSISEGVKAGDWSVGFPNVRTAVMQLKRDKDGNPMTDEKRQQILDGYQKYMQNATQIELLYTQLYLSKQGQVTEGERKLVRATGVDKEDSPNVVKAKANAIVARGQFDEKAATAFLDWEKKNPGGTLEEFQLKSPEYKALKGELNSEMERIYKTHFGKVTRPGAPSTEPTQAPGVDRSNRWLR